MIQLSTVIAERKNLELTILLAILKSNCNYYKWNKCDHVTDNGLLEITG